MFEQFLNTEFTINEKELPPASLRLVEITNNKYKEKSLFGKTTDSFSLIFESAEENMLEVRIYEFSHPEMDVFSLFISKFDKAGKYYQAVFSRVYF